MKIVDSELIPLPGSPSILDCVKYLLDHKLFGEDKVKLLFGNVSVHIRPDSNPEDIVDMWHYRGTLKKLGHVMWEP